MTPPVVRVVAGALIRDGQVLIARRPPGKHMAGAWEFPGGKIAAGESEAAALARELREEIGIEARSSHHVMNLTHDYPEKTVQLSFWVVDDFEGAPLGLEGQALKWVPLGLLSQEDLLPADRPFIEALLYRNAKH
jgi:8-oxo-dGTP diphosphatase